MPHEHAVRYDFRPLTVVDLPLVGRWLAAPHAAEWWRDDAQGNLAEVAAAIDDVATTPLMVELDGRPIAYMQSYDPHLEDGHPYQDQPPGTLGLDITIGPPELLGRGHGSAIIRQFAEIAFAAGAPRIIIDPDPDNQRAIRTCEKAGFRAGDRRTSIYGDAVLMALDAEAPPP